MRQDCGSAVLYALGRQPWTSCSWCRIRQRDWWQINENIN